MDTAEVPLLEARGIQKRFGRVVALRDGNFRVYPGQVSALLGDNGAGKSTLIKILSGAFSPDGGRILIDGGPVQLTSPAEARSLGIETVYQDLALAATLDIAGNMFLGRELYKPPPLSWLRVLDRRTMQREARGALDKLRVHVPSVTQAVNTLSGGQRQAVAVARAVFWGKRVVIMDEPTAALGVRESAMVLKLITQIRDQGIAVIMISHNLPEVFEVADRLTVLRLGRTIAELSRAETTMNDIVAMMTGAEIEVAASMGV
jgi:ABC-type sugar transport system ATPase subunit